ncbi:hypothetical protein BN136_3537 [Cronobacter universalis NCTC 9529]|nr:hypothetical protein BN136_3537 [Cronobacter universalis NCTC 9529]
MDNPQKLSISRLDSALLFCASSNERLTRVRFCGERCDL